MNVVNINNKKQDNRSLVEKVLSDIEGRNLRISDSDMFAYCEQYTGNFWSESRQKKAA